MPEVSVIILTLNSEEIIESCLDSVFPQLGEEDELIVVDNGSEDNTVSIVKTRYPQVVLIRNEINRGACQARNQGIAVSNGDWILTLDCDVVLKQGFIDELSKVIDGLSSDIGIIQPKILRGDKQTIYSTGIFLSFFRRFHDIGHNQHDAGQFQQAGEIFGACSAAAAYRRSMLEAIKEESGYFDERFFFLAEDVDLSWRSQKKGYKALYSPNIICYHAGNSSQINQRLRQYLCLRNRYYAIRKNEGWVRYLKKIIPPLFYDLPRLSYIAATNPYFLKKIKHNFYEDTAVK